MNRDHDSYFWDARSYEKVSSAVQLKWGQALVEKRKWLGNETVMDAGSGSGSLTRVLAKKVPNGRVYAVDTDPNMVQHASTNLSDYRNVQIFKSSMEDAILPTQVDVIFSNAALHWVPKLDRVFMHFWQMLRPGGELLIECGGNGNLDRLVSLIFNLMQLDQFREYFVGWKPTWYFPRHDETEKLLNNIGFRDVEVRLSRRTLAFPDRESFTLFTKTVIMKPFLGYLPDKKKDNFLEAFLTEVQNLRLGWLLDSVRLNIFARK